jgi:outer membrane lipoprotein
MLYLKTISCLPGKENHLMRTFVLIIMCGLLMLSGCTRVISEQSRQLVDTDAKFMQIRETPEKYIGKHVMVGGRIAAVKNGNDGSQLEIVQFELMESGAPEESFVSSGRFLATTPQFLDTLIFKKGMLITLVGEIKGEKIQRLDEMEYAYPVIAMREWYLWKGSDWDRETYYMMQPPLYDPYYYGYGIEPYWFRPYGPPLRPR